MPDPLLDEDEEDIGIFAEDAVETDDEDLGIFAEGYDAPEEDEDLGIFASDYREDFDPRVETPPAPEILEEDDDPTWQDYGRMVMAGGASIGAGVGWLLQKAGAEDIGGAVRERSEESRRAWMEDKLTAIGIDQEGLSEQARTALSTEFLGEGKLGDKWNKAKITAAASLLGTMAGMGLGGVLTKGLAAVGVGGRTGAAIGYGAGEAGVAAPSAGAATEEEVLSMKHAQLMDSLEYQAAYDGMKGLEETERQERAKKLVADAAAGKAAAITLLSTFILSAPFSQTVGRLAGTLPVPGGRIAGTVKGGLGEATQEFLQSGAEKIAENIAIQQEAQPDRPLTKGALEEAVGGAMSGAIIGAPAGAFAPGAEEEEAGPSPVDEIEDLQDQARADAAAAGGDMLDQEMAAADVGAEVGGAYDEGLREMQRRVDEDAKRIEDETAYAEEQVKEDELRQKQQDEAMARYEEFVKKEEEGFYELPAKEEGFEKAEAEAAKKKEAEVKEAEFQREIQKGEEIEKTPKRPTLAEVMPEEVAAIAAPKPEPVAVTKPRGIPRKPKLPRQVDQQRVLEEIETEGEAAATAPASEIPLPTEAQKTAGNYKKGHVRIQGLDVTIENPPGSERGGRVLKDSYGYIKRTEGADGEQVDVFLGPAPLATEVFIVDQIDQNTGQFDEHKAMIGYPNKLAAVRAYKRNYDRGWKVGPITKLNQDEFKAWLKSTTKKPLKAEKTPAREPTQGQLSLEEVIQDVVKPAKQRRRGPLKKSLPKEGRNVPTVSKTGTASLSHWSGKKGLKVLDPAFHGKGIRGAEAKRKANSPQTWVDRAYFGIDVGKEGGYKKEYSLGPNRYDVEVPAESLYDIQEDPDNLRDGLEEEARALGSDPVNLYEKRIKEAGYKGYWADTMGLVAAVFDPVSIEAMDTGTLAVRLDTEGGFTVDPATGTDKKEGYAVGIGAERKFTGLATAEEISKYMEDNAEQLAQPNQYLGGWVYEGETYLDISRVFPNTPLGRQQAITLGKQNEEIGIMDLSKSPEEGYIPLKGIKLRRDKASSRMEVEAPPTLITKEMLDEEFKSILRYLPVLGEVVEVHENVASGPEDVANELRRTNNTGTYGAFDTKTGKIHIFANAHNSVDHAIQTLLHEGVGHKGLRMFLEDKLPDIMLDVYKSADPKVIKQIEKTYRLNPDIKADNIEAGEEYVAHIAETGTHQNLLDKIVAMIRDVLRDLGLVHQWTEKDVVNLLKKARGDLTGRRKKVTVATKAKIAETGEIVEIEENAATVLARADKRIDMLEKLRTCVG